MENLSMKQERGNEGERTHETLKAEARAAVDAELARRLEGYEAHETNALHSALIEMLAEYAAVIPGTQIPEDNARRYHAEYVQSLLLEWGRVSGVEAYMAQTAPREYIEKANPSAYRVAPEDFAQLSADNDNREQLPAAT